MKSYFMWIMMTLLACKYAMPTDPHSSKSDIRLVVLHHGIAILPCDAELEQASIIQYSWYKDGIPVVVEGDDHIQITGEGHLWVKDTKTDDSGLYVCHVVTNLGTKEVNVTLIVLVPEGIPFFNNFSSPEASIQRTVGSSVRFRCPANGNPRPYVTWFKDDVILSNTSFPELKFSRWSIVLRNLELANAGNYTCYAINRLGSVNATFTLQVTAKENRKISLYNGSQPDLAVFHPLNTTVKYGSSATFQCRVRSEATPNIQWLKRIEDSESSVPREEEHDTLKVQGENFRVLQSSQVVERSDGSYLNKLVLQEAHESDTGKYICLGANSMGYSFRSAYLTVLPRPRALPLGWSRSVSPHPGHPNSLLVAIPITLGVLVGVLVALVVLCHRRRLDTPYDTRSLSSSRKLYLRQTSRTATTALDGGKSEKEEEVIPPVNGKVESSSCQVQSEVELAGGGATVTRLYQQQTSSTNYDACFVLRDEV